MKFDITKLGKILPEIEVIDGPDGMYAYMFVKGKYAGIAYTYMDVKIVPVSDEDDAELEVKFSYDILSNFKNVKISNDEFNQTIGDILVLAIDAMCAVGSIDDE